MTATVIADRIRVERHESLGDGVEGLTIRMVPGDDYDEYRAMPDCLSFRDRLYGKSCFNTDRWEYVYRTDKVCAVLVSDVLTGQKTHERVIG